MKPITKFIYNLFNKEDIVKKREAKTKKYAREVIDKNEKALRRLSYE